jgi:dihydrofolate synthase/folylpolyglutamate synthase
MDETQLQELAKSYGLSGNHYKNVNLALATALQNATKDDLILVCGSVFVVGEVELKISY